MKPVIGILGGMGPRATVQFEQMLLEGLPGNDQSLPLIISINDGSIPDRSEFLLGFGADPTPQLINNLMILEAAGAGIVCIPCNTACAPPILERLKQVAKIPIIDLPKVVARSLADDNISQTLVLATAGTVAAGIYQLACEQLEITCLTPNQHLQATVTALIKAIKAKDTSQVNLLCPQLRLAIEQLGTDSVILGCTELSLVATDIAPPGCRAFDSLDILAATTVSYVKEINYDARPIYTQ